MNTLKGLIEKALKDDRMTQRDLAAAIDVSPGTIGNILANIQPKNLGVLRKFAGYFKVDVAELLERGTTKETRAVYKVAPLPRGFVMAPVISRASCGKWRDFTDLSFPGGHADYSMPAATSDEQAFYVIATGDSMTGEDIRDGDLLLVEPSKEVRDGQIVLAHTDEGCTVKKFFRHKEHIELRPMSPDHKSLFVKDDKTLRCYRITGVFRKK